MADIAEFAQQATERFIETQKGTQERFDLNLPRQEVEGFIRTAFYASLIPDEGRYPTVCLMSYRKGSEVTFHFLFDSPIAPSAQEVGKLAHATGAGSHICCVCNEGKIALAGIHVTELNPMREFGYSSSRIASPLKLIIRGPGHIEMSTGGIALVYKAGQITEEKLFQQSDLMERLAAIISQELSNLTKGKVEAIEDIFNDLAKGIVRLGHGGIVLVAGQPSRTQFSSSRWINCLLLQQLLIEYWNDVATLTASSGGPGNLIASSEAGEVNPLFLSIASDTTKLENCIESIANLTGVDGAIVLDYACGVAAFNAIIARPTATQSLRLVDQIGRDLRSEDILRNKGARHQSALAYALQVPNSFAFVISQDGGISGFHNPANGTVVCETEMRVLE
jgi:hypothetical protein